MRIGALGAIVAWLGWGITVTVMMSDFNLLSTRTDAWIRVLQLVSLPVFFGAAGAGLWNAAVVLRGRRRWYAKAWAITLAAFCLTILWTALAFHLIAFDVNY